MIACLGMWVHSNIYYCFVSNTDALLMWNTLLGSHIAVLFNATITSVIVVKLSVGIIAN